MGHAPFKDEDFVVDLESGDRRTENESLDDQLVSADDSFVSLSIGPLDNVLKVVIDSKEVDFSVKKIGKEKRKKGSSAKKPPKPPRPPTPRGFSLDAADQKLIKELAELAMMKRARIERMKALQAKKALRASSSSSSSMSGGSLFAMLFTVIFFMMMLLQGMSCKSPGVTPIGSPQTAQTKENGLIFIQEQLNPSASNSILPHTRSSNLFKKISGSASASRKIL